MSVLQAPVAPPDGGRGRLQLQVEIREACPEDADALAELAETVVRANDSYPPAARDALVESASAHAFTLRALHTPETLLVAVAPGTSHPVGYVLTSLCGTGVLTIEALGVASASRRAGVGTVLLHDTLRRADRAGAYKVIADVPAPDGASRRFYTHSGLDATTRIPDEIPDLLRALPAPRPAPRTVAYTPGPHYPVESSRFHGAEAFDLRTAPNHDDGLLLATVHQQLATAANARLYGSAALAERVLDAIFRIVWQPDGETRRPLEHQERMEVLRLCRLYFTALDHGDRGEFALVQLACPLCGFLPPVCSMDGRTPDSCRVLVGPRTRRPAPQADPLHGLAT